MPLFSELFRSDASQDGAECIGLGVILRTEMVQRAEIFELESLEHFPEFAYREGWTDGMPVYHQLRKAARGVARRACAGSCRGARHGLSRRRGGDDRERRGELRNGRLPAGVRAG